MEDASNFGIKIFQKFAVFLHIKVSLCKKERLCLFLEISEANKFLEEAFDVLNTHFFESALPKVKITIQSSPLAYGHFSLAPIWSDEIFLYNELNISAENLNRPLPNLLATLLHEMVHLYCFVKDIKDTSRGHTYHNKHFKREAEKRGLIIEYDKRIGHSITSPSNELEDFIYAQKWHESIPLCRRNIGTGDKATRKPSSTRKLICPDCGMSVRATREVRIMCMDCGKQLVIEKNMSTPLSKTACPIHL